MADLDKLRAEAQRQANEYGVTVLLILDPPSMPVGGYKSANSYVTHITHATAEEKKAAVERFEPRKDVDHARQSKLP